jgi:hypothetical protein
MPSRREQVLAQILQRLRAALSATVRCNEALPERVPAEGLVILRDGGPGEPDVMLNLRTEFYRHRIELEVLVTSVPDGGADAALDNLIEVIAAALAPNPWLSGLAENLRLGAPDVGALAIEGAVPILTARLNLTVEYLVDDPLAAHW